MTTLEPAGAPSPRAAEDAPYGTTAQPETSGNSTLYQSEVARRLDNERIEREEVERVISNPVFETVPDEDELDEDHEVFRELRAARREAQRKRGHAQIAAEDEHAQAQLKLDAEDLKEQVTLRMAQRKRRQLTDGGANLAAAYRKYRLVVGVLMSGLLFGITWTSNNVAKALGGETPHLIHYVVEPIFSLPLVVLVFMQMVAAENGLLGMLSPVRRTQRGWWIPTRVGLIEVFLLTNTVLIATWPVISADQFNLERLVLQGVAPVMVVLFTVLLGVAAEFFGRIIRDAWLAGDDSDSNQRERAKRAGSLAKQVRLAMADEQNPMPVGEDGLPSISAIQKRFPSEKLTAQVAHDMLALFKDIEGVS